MDLESQQWERAGAEAEAPILKSPDAKRKLTGKDPDAGKDYGQEEKGMTEDEMVRWHHQLNGREFEQTPGDGEGQRSLVCCSPWGCEVRHDWVTEQQQNCFLPAPPKFGQSVCQLHTLQGQPCACNGCRPLDRSGLVGAVSSFTNPGGQMRWPVTRCRHCSLEPGLRKVWGYTDSSQSPYVQWVSQINAFPKVLHHLYDGYLSHKSLCA